MRLKINFELYPDYDNKFDKNSVFKIDNPKIEINEKELKNNINIFFNENLHNKDHLYVNFRKYENEVYFDIFIDLYNEDDKLKINEKIEDLILDIIDELGIGLYRRKDITDKIKVELTFNNAIFYNTYKYYYKHKNDGSYKWLKLIKSIGESNGKLARYNYFIKK